MKWGCFGGSFDPIHRGHLWLAKKARERLGLDRVVFVPAQINPLKSKFPSASGTDRLKMCELACRDEQVQGFTHSSIELERSGPSFTFDTVEALQRQYSGQWHLILGSDAAAFFPQWHRVKELLARVDLFIAIREHQLSAQALVEILRQVGFADARVESQNHGFQVRYLGDQRRIECIDDTAPPWSATALREALRNEPTQCPEALHPGVWKFIKEKSLYADKK